MSDAEDETLAPATLPPDPLATFNPDSLLTKTAGIPDMPSTRPQMRPAAPVELPPGSERAEGVSSFTLRRVIAKGGMGEIWEAVQGNLRRVVAVKRLRADIAERSASDSSAAAYYESSFREEAFTAAQLDHPNIVPVHDMAHDAEGHPLLAMKLVRGTPWPRAMSDDRREMGQEDFIARHVAILVSVSQAVAFAHSRGIVHRDLKPGQVMLGEFGEVLLMDWGLALNYDPDVLVRAHGEEAIGYMPTSDSASNPAGTPAFMAPEQTEVNAKRIGPWTDVYLLGGTLCMLLTGRPPRTAGSSQKAFSMAASGRFESLANEPVDGKQLPANLVELCHDCLCPVTTGRPTTTQFIQRLQEHLSGARARRESVELVRLIATRLEAAEGDYHRYGEIISQLNRARSLWDANPEVEPLLQRAQSGFAMAALQRGDLVLATVQAETLPDAADRQKLLGDISQAQRRIVARERTRRMALFSSATLLAMVLVGALGCNNLLSRRAKTEAHLRSLAEDARKRSDDLAKSEAHQRLLAEESRKRSDELVTYMLGELQDKLRPLGRLDVMDSVLEKVDEQLATNTGELTLSDHLAHAKLLLMVSVVRNSQGKLPEAEAAARQALSEVGILVDNDPQDPEWQMYLGHSLSRIGHILQDQGKESEASAFFDRNRQVQEKLVERFPEESNFGQNLARAWTDESIVLERLSSTDKAIEAQLNAQKIFEKLVKDEPDNLELEGYLGNSFSHLGNLLRRQGRFPESLAAYERTLAIREKQLAANPNSAPELGELADILQRIAPIQQRTEQFEEAEASFVRALGICRKLSETDPMNAEARLNVAYALRLLGSLHLARDRNDDALKDYEEALAIYEELFSAHPENMNSLEGINSAHVALGDISRQKGDIDEALSHYQKNREGLRQLLEVEPGNKEYRSNLAVALTRIASISQARKKLDKALDYYRQAQELFEELVAEDPEGAEPMRGVAGSSGRMAVIFEEQEKYDEAIAAFRVQQAAMEELARRAPTNATWNYEAAFPWRRIARMLEKQGKLAEAYEADLTNRDLLDKIVVTFPKNEDFLRDLAFANNDMGTYLADSNRPAEALDAFGRAAKAMEGVLALNPENTRVTFVLAPTYGRVGNMRLVLGDAAEALADYHRAADLAGSRGTVDKGQRRFLGDVHVSMADALIAMGDLKGARIEIEEAQCLLEPLLDPEEADSQVLQLSWVDMKLTLARLEQAEGNATGAQAACAEVIRILTPPVERGVRNRQILRNHAIALLRLGRAEDAREVVEFLQADGYANAVFMMELKDAGYVVDK